MDPIQAFMQANSLTTPLFPPDSRYYGLPSAQYTQPDGTVVAYVKRRFVPPPESFSLLVEHTVVEGDRLDNLAANYIGDPIQYWRLCDANGAIRPAALTETAGSQLGIAMPNGVPGATNAG